MKRSIMSAMCIFLCFFLAACNLLGDSPAEVTSYDPEFIQTGWVFHNVDPGYQRHYWKRMTEQDASIYLEWSLVYTGDQIPVDEIVSFSIRSGDSLITIPPQHLIGYPSTSHPGRYIIRTNYWWRDAFSPHALPLGPWTYEFSLANGQNFSYITTYNRPGTITEASAGDLLYTEQYTGSATHYPMVKRALIQDLTIDAVAGTLTCTFTINDPNTYSGWLHILDENGTYIRGTNRFVSSDGTVSSELAGQVFHTDGTQNILTAVAANYPGLELSTSKFYFAYIDTIDGEQFEGTEIAGGYDNMAKSAVHPVVWDPVPDTGGLLVKIEDPSLAGMYALARVYDSGVNELARSDYFQLDYLGMGFDSVADDSGQNKVFSSSDGALFVDIHVYDQDDVLHYESLRYVVINGPTTLLFQAVDNEL